MEDEQPTCGKGLAAHAPLPAKLGELVSATAAVLESHLGMLDLSDPLSAAEHAVYAEIIEAHLRAGEALREVARRMTAARDLPMGRHVDRAEANAAMGRAFAGFVEREVELRTMLTGRLAQDRRMMALIEQHSASQHR